MCKKRSGRVFIAAFIVLSLILADWRVQAQGGGDNPPPGMTIHVVQRGENLFRIAIHYGTTVEAIAQANGIEDTAILTVGQRLLIPNASPSAPGMPTNYIVSPGDSLFKLAARFGTSMQAIAQQNRITNPAQMYIGQPLALQEGSTGSIGIKAGWIYIVQPDDNLYRIAARYSVSIDRVMRLNNLWLASVLVPGQRLAIPGPEDGPEMVDLPAPFARLTMSSVPPEQGRTVRFQVLTLAPALLEGTFMDRSLVVFSDDSHTQHTMLFGVNAFAQPGIYTLRLVATDNTGQQTALTRLVAVADGGYQSEIITLPPDEADLLDPNVTGPELQQVLDIVGKVTAQRYFNGPLGLPCPAPVTSQFGTRRAYNGGAYDQFHTGTDFAGMTGSPITAPAPGVVVFAGTLHVRGNATIIDHGWGVFTGYWHQQTINVRVGDVVQQGQVIGAIGQTGRATGPHLHWELFVGGIQVDPLQWTRQSFP
jgi:murein DD-endopeptidase MepM/ murein hydrolase activator NlpD